MTKLQIELTARAGAADRGKGIMTITLTSTTKIVTLVTPRGEVPARIWEGHTDSGIPVHAYITRIAVAPDQDATQFERELQECPPAVPSTAIEAIPLRLIL